MVRYTITTTKPFKSNSDDDVDGAAQEDVIERVESLGEQISVDST